MKNRILAHCTDKSPLEKFLFKLADQLICEKGKARVIFASSFSFSGFKTLPAFGEVSVLYRVGGQCVTAFMLALEGIARERGARVTVSYSPLDRYRPESIYFHGSNCLVTSSAFPPCTNALSEKRISLNRFMDKECVGAVHSRLCGLDKVMKELLTAAQKELVLAREAHLDIEQIYIPAMDFSAMDEFTFNFIEKLFG